jgi:hypothetical protein
VTKIARHEQRAMSEGVHGMGEAEARTNNQYALFAHSHVDNP